MAAGKDVTFSLGCRGAEEFLVPELPEPRALADASVEVFEHVSHALEWAEDKDYGTADGGTDAKADAITGQLASGF